MKKIGIITLSGYVNYGNKLQNYALQEVLRKKGFFVETIWNEDAKNSHLKTVIKKNLHLIKECFIYKKNIFAYNKKRKKIFINFSNQYIKNSKIKISSKKNNNILNDIYDFFVVGSDQVWNYNDLSFSGIYFLDFSNDKRKNISYAASFGVDSLPKEKYPFYKVNLKNFNYISVREKTSLSFLNDMGIKNAINVLDPTMLLTSKEWEEKLSLKKIVEEKYIFTYFLSENKELEKEIEKYAEKKHYKVIHLFDKKNSYYVSGPKEFLSYIKYAEMIFTDSFHSIVFSILFQKNFVCVDRKTAANNITNSRMYDLLSMLNLNSRKYDEKQDISFYENFNYKKEIADIINDMRAKSNHFLDTALGLIDENK